MDEIGETFGPLSHGLAGMVSLPRGIPQDVEFKVAGGPFMGLFEPGQPDLHDLLGRRQGFLAVLGIAAGPEGWKDLETGNFAPLTDRIIVVAAFQHGKS